MWGDGQWLPGVVKVACVASARLFLSECDSVGVEIERMRPSNVCLSCQRVNSNSTLDIQYDKGPEEFGVLRQRVRPEVVVADPT